MEDSSSSLKDISVKWKFVWRIFKQQLAKQREA
jgi:hypothetical protein